MAHSDRYSVMALLLQRLERISADSRWAHLASGYRGSLLAAIDEIEKGTQIEPGRLDALITGGTGILNQAARERLSRRSIRWR